MTDRDRASSQSWSGLPLDVSYGPQEAGQSYREKLGDPGTFPFTRGGHPEMYRKRLWITRQLCGLDTPEATNARLRYLIANGQTGLAIVPDTPTQLGFDSDHPLGERSAGTQGVPLASVEDMDRMLAGIDLSAVTASFSVPGVAATVLFGQLLSVAGRRGVPLTSLRGSFQNDPLQATHTSYDAGTPIELGLRLCIDMMEHCARHVPGFHAITVNSYDLRESGLDAPQEIGVAIAMARTYIRETMKRGLSVDQFGPGILLISAAHIDLFEEVAKFRAARRIWARMMRDEFGAKEDRTCRLTLAVHTAGSSLVAPQPANNIARSTVEALAAILGGCQGLDLSGFDEPVDLPSEEAARVSLRTQQILALEAGVANVADPLGGSWYVESLTDAVEARALAVMDEIEQQGGMVKAAQSGWLRRLIEQMQFKLQSEIASGQRPVVGLNCHTIPPEEDRLLSFRGTHPEPSADQVRSVRVHRASRDRAAVKTALADLKARAQSERENLIPAMTAAASAGATVGEVLGTIRVAHGLAYDPVGQIAEGSTV
ncbi:MAG: methylmalonyl-CoA mutase family protein [Hyphomicrobiaceae bacterium]